MRQVILSPRWIMWHLLTLGAMATCGWLAAWQWQRAGSALGSALNVGYGLQWPVFAVFFAVMWWRMLRLEVAALRAEGAAEESEPSPALPPTGVQPLGARRTAAGPSPFGPRPAASTAPPVDDDPELAAYNRMLARLAARHPDD